MYKLNQNSIIRLSDNASIPLDEGNTDYQSYLLWVEEGNTPSAIDLPSVAERKAIKQREIDVLESADKCGRRYRESYLLSCVEKAAELGFTEPQAYAANPGYRGAKDLNTQITALRAELRAIV